MKPDEQRIAIAEWCGFVPGVEKEYPYRREWTKDFVSYCDCDLPDYLNDLNAMWDAEEKLTDHSGYWQQLEWIIGVPLKFSLCHATAAQRAEALLRTIGKWTDSTLHTKG